MNNIIILTVSLLALVGILYIFVSALKYIIKK